MDGCLAASWSVPQGEMRVLEDLQERRHASVAQIDDVAADTVGQTLPGIYEPPDDGASFARPGFVGCLTLGHRLSPSRLTVERPAAGLAELEKRDPWFSADRIRDTYQVSFSAAEIRREVYQRRKAELLNAVQRVNRDPHDPGARPCASNQKGT